MTPEQWKFNRKMMHQAQQQQQHQQFQQQMQAQQQQQQKQKEEIQIRNNSNPGSMGRPPSGPSSDDGRHVIRLAQTPSPRSKHEPISPPETNAPPHFYPLMDHRGNLQPGHPQLQHHQQNKAPQSSTFMMERYVKNRIVEAMRTEDGQGQEKDQQKSQKDDDEDRPKSSGPANPSKSSAKLESQQHHLIYPTSRGSQQQPPQFYPFSALNVSAASGQGAGNPLPVPVQIKTSVANENSGGPGQNQMDNQRPLLSDQYEALSDED